MVRVCKNLVQLDVLVIESFTSCSLILFEKFPLFMRDRFIKDFWTFISHNTHDESIIVTSCSLKMLKLLFNTLNFGILNCKPSTKICLEILNYLKKRIFFDISGDIYKSISIIEPDIIWYFYSIELGGIDEIISPFSELKSFKIPSKNDQTNDQKMFSDLLKSKLKQFIK